MNLLRFYYSGKNQDFQILSEEITHFLETLWFHYYGEMLMFLTQLRKETLTVEISHWKFKDYRKLNCQLKCSTIHIWQEIQWGGEGRCKGINMFCSTKLWDLELTWYTTNPDFTSCFHLTVLTFVPTLVLLLTLPFQVN